MKKRKRIIALILSFVLVFLCACSKNNAGQDGEGYVSTNENTINIGVYNFDTYNPIATVSQSVSQTSALIYDSLVRRKTDKSIELRLCNNYSVSNDGLTYTFNLRNDISWHDGSEFVAEDVEYTFKMIETVAQSAYKGRLDNVKEYIRTGKNTFVVSLYSPDGSFISFMDMPIIKNGTDCVNSLKEYIPIGTGPYKYIDSDLSRAIHLVRNENYIVGQKPLIEQIIIKQLPDKEALLSALEAREIEAVPFTASQMRNYNPKGNLNTVAYTNNILTFIGINTTRPGLDKALVRRAMSYSINRDEIAQNVYFGRADGVNVPIAPDSFLSKQIYHYERDTQRAIKLLNEAGYTMSPDGVMLNSEGSPLSFNLYVSLGNELRASAAEKIKENLAQIGVNIRILKLSFEDYQTQISTHEYDMFIGEVKIGKNHDISSFIGSSAQYCVYPSERADSLLRRCKNATNAPAFEKSYNELAEIFLSNAPIIPIVMGTDALVLNSKIKGVTPPVEGNIFSNIETWYIEN